MMDRRTLYGAGLFTLALLGCTPARPGMYAVYNYSGKTVIAPTVADDAGGHGAFEQAIDDRDVWFFGAAGPVRRGTTITIEWIAGAGRATWYRATLPVTLEQAGGKMVEIYLRPDRFVCASLVDDAHQSNRSDDTVRAKIRQDRQALACAQPAELPPLRDGMAAGFDEGSTTHSWALYDRTGTATLVNRTLAHRTGRVALRFGNDYKDRPYVIDEFMSVRPLGNRAAWLVKTRLDGAQTGLFVVTGNATGWQSRFLGGVGEEETRLSANRVLFGKEIVVDTATADVYVLPRYRGMNHWILGQSPDGRRIALYREAARTALEGRAGIRFDVAMLDLDTGQDEPAQIDRLPTLPPGRMIYEFYGDWYRDHCAWTPLLACR